MQPLSQAKTACTLIPGAIQRRQTPRIEEKTSETLDKHVLLSPCRPSDEYYPNDSPSRRRSNLAFDLSDLSIRVKASCFASMHQSFAAELPMPRLTTDTDTDLPLTNQNQQRSSLPFGTAHHLCPVDGVHLLQKRRARLHLAYGPDLVRCVTRDADIIVALEHELDVADLEGGRVAQLGQLAGRGDDVVGELVGECEDGLFGRGQCLVLSFEMTFLVWGIGACGWAWMFGGMGNFVWEKVLIAGILPLQPQAVDPLPARRHCPLRRPV